MIAIIVLQCVCVCVYMESTWRQFLCVVKPHTVAVYTLVDTRYIQVCFAPGLLCGDLLLLYNTLIGKSACQPKQRSGNN